VATEAIEDTEPRLERVVMAMDELAPREAEASIELA